MYHFTPFVRYNTKTSLRSGLLSLGTFNSTTVRRLFNASTLQQTHCPNYQCRQTSSINWHFLAAPIKQPLTPHGVRTKISMEPRQQTNTKPHLPFENSSKIFKAVVPRTPSQSTGTQDVDGSRNGVISLVPS